MLINYDGVGDDLYMVLMRRPMKIHHFAKMTFFASESRTMSTFCICFILTLTCECHDWLYLLFVTF